MLTECKRTTAILVIKNLLDTCKEEPSDSELDKCIYEFIEESKVI